MTEMAVPDFKALQKLEQEQQLDVVSSSALADQDGFIFMPSERKTDLVGSAFYIVKAQMLESPNYGEYISVWIVTENNNRLKFTDFSTGIREQLRPMLVGNNNASPDGMALFCENGLRESRYDADPERGRPAGVTYYLDTSGGRLPTGKL